MNTGKLMAQKHIVKNTNRLSQRAQQKSKKEKKYHKTSVSTQYGQTNILQVIQRTVFKNKPAWSNTQNL